MFNDRYFLEKPLLLRTEQPPIQPQPSIEGGAPVNETPGTTKLTVQAEAIATEIIRKRQVRTSQGMLQEAAPIQSEQLFNKPGPPSRNIPFSADSFPNNSERFAEAPEGIPSIRGWKVRVEGGISGIIYGSPSAEDGDYIETSPIARGTIKDGTVVETTSGSRYFLSAASADTAHNILNTLKGFAADRRGGTITITKRGGDEQGKQRNRQIAQSAIDVLEKSLPRATFSLMDLFGVADKEKAKARPPKLPPLAPADKAPPDGVAKLSNWTSNDDGTLTGFVFGSRSIGDGNLVTTSRIVRGERKQYEIVTTVSGSLYFLT